MSVVRCRGVRCSEEFEGFKCPRCGWHRVALWHKYPYNVSLAMDDVIGPRGERVYWVHVPEGCMAVLGEL